MFLLRCMAPESLGDKARASVFAKRLPMIPSTLMLEPLEYNTEEVSKGSRQSCVSVVLVFTPGIMRAQIRMYRSSELFGVEFSFLFALKCPSKYFCT